MIILTTVLLAFVVVFSGLLGLLAFAVVVALASRLLGD